MHSKHSKKRNIKAQSKREFEKELLKIDEGLKNLKGVDPATLTHFKQLPISKATSKGLQQNGWYDPTQVQRLTLPYTLLGHDVVAGAKTGSGKTLAYLIPILETLYRERWDANSGLGAIIITPTQELSYQIHSMLQMLAAHHKFTCGKIIGGQDLAWELRFISSINIIVCTPGRLYHHLCENKNLQTDGLKLLVLDEADECLKNCFANQMNDILMNLPTDRQTLLFSATQTTVIKDLIRSGCKKPVFCSTHENVSTPTPTQLHQGYVTCEVQEKLNMLCSFLQHYKKKKILVFMATCKQVKYSSTVIPILLPQLKVLSLHGRIKTTERMARYERFLGEDRIVMLATDVAARGLDFAEVDWVVQMDCPEDVTTYIHRVGRTARYYQKGKAILFLTPQEEKPMVKNLRSKGIPIESFGGASTDVKNIQHRVEDILCKEPSFIEIAERAFKCYLKSIAMMKDREVFDVSSVNRELFASSYGLISAPKVKFVEKVIMQRNKKIATKTLNDEREDNDTINEYECIENDEEDLINLENEILDEDKNNPSEFEESRKCSFDEIFVTCNELTGPLATPPTDYSKYLRKVKVEQQQELAVNNSNMAVGPDISKIIVDNKIANNKAHKLKLKEKRRILKKKRDDRRGKKGDKSAALEGGSDSELDEFTQQIIDELPDPDRKRRRSSDSEGSVYTGEKVPCKRSKEELDEDFDDEFGGRTLREQENLALQLLSARR